MTRTRTRGVTVTTPSTQEIVLTRAFNAPRQLVFDAHSSCEYLRRWWARGHAMDCELDFRPGGSWRFVEHTPDGQTYAFRGEYREIVSPIRLVYTFEYEGAPGHIGLVTTVFSERDGMTVLTETTLFNSVDERDEMLESGMVDGANRSMDELDKLLFEMEAGNA